MTRLIMIMMLLAICTAGAGWHYHYYTEADIELIDRVNGGDHSRLLGRLWWMQHRPGEPDSHNLPPEERKLEDDRVTFRRHGYGQTNYTLEWTDDLQAGEWRKIQTFRCCGAGQVRTERVTDLHRDDPFYDAADAFVRIKGATILEWNTSREIPNE